MNAHLFANAETPQAKLDGVEMTVGYVVGQLYDACEEFRARFDGGVRISECESKDLSSGEGLGFTSNIVRLCIHFTDPKLSPDFSTVLKAFSIEKILDLWKHMGDTPDAKEAAQKTMQSLNVAHNAECDFYTMFGEKGVLPLARCFMAQKMEMEGENKQPGILAMEDLSRTAKVIRLEESLSVEKVSFLMLAAYINSNNQRL